MGKEETPVITPVEPIEEPKPKKVSFFRELIRASSDASSKRFTGLMFATVFAICSIVSVAGVDLSDNALELIKMEGILGVSLLGLNAIPQVITSFKK